MTSGGESSLKSSAASVVSSSKVATDISLQMISIKSEVSGTRTFTDYFYLSHQRGARQAAGQEDRTRAAGRRRGSFPRLLHQWTHQLLQEEPLLNVS